MSLAMGIWCRSAYSISRVRDDDRSRRRRCGCNHLAAQLVDVFARVADVAAHACAHLHHRGMHLRLHPLLQPQLARGQHFRFDMRAQIARHRIDGLVFLFNAKRVLLKQSLALFRIIHFATVASCVSAPSLPGPRWDRQLRDDHRLTTKETEYTGLT